MPGFLDPGELMQLDSPDVIIEALQQHARRFALDVYGAYRLPQPPQDYRRGYSIGRSAFIHPGALTHFTEHLVQARQRGPNVLARMSWARRMPFTMTEGLRLARPNEGERWVFNLLRAHGIRDMLYCPIDDWIVIFCSSKVMRFSLADRGRLYTLAMHAALRLNEIVEPMKTNGVVRLSTREIAVLFYLSNGASDGFIARELGIGQHTIKSYVKRAKDKLGAKTREHAVGEAMRRLLIR